ncbi:transglutaminase-like domain-containing protein [Clostridium sp.]|uniref:transglutaminase-like domain-containing protein n=1 Tax=Clostridium sp. TaxID=1506 RepID=UPI0025C1C51F|nr:transglutaminase-like domain-containing protein [Clostridium sp.]
MIVIINNVFNNNIDISKKVCEEIENSIVYNPYEVALMLDNILKKDIKENCEDLDIWNRLVLETAKEIQNKYEKHLIVPAKINKIENLIVLKNNFLNIDSEVYVFNITSSIEYIQNDEEEYHNINVNDKSNENIKSIIIDKIKILSSDFLNNEFLINKTYIIKGSKIDVNLLNSSHQSVKNLYRKKPNYEIILETHPLVIQQELNIERLEKYLMPTKSIECDSIDIKKLAESLIGNEKNKLIIINKILEFTRNIEFDDELSTRIYEGEDTQSALNTISIMKGSYGECTNVFIALCRASNIPAKFILGKTSRNLYHTWAEVYIQGVGWIPVETRINIPVDINKGYFGITNKHIKVYEGVDFEDINVKLYNLDIDLEVLNKEKVYD